MKSNLTSILYKTTNTVNNKIYIGVHVTNKLDTFDGYYGCGITGENCYWFKNAKYPFQKACVKYGLQAFVRETLQVFDTLEEALQAEANMVDEAFVKRKDTYNVALGGGSGLVPSTEKEIHQYDLYGNYINSYRSRSQAARELDLHSAVISNAVNLKTRTGDYYWSDYKVDILDISEYTKVLEVGVYLYDETTFKFVKEYPSISAAARDLNVNYSSVNHAITFNTKCLQYYISTKKVDTLKVSCKERIVHSHYYRYDLQGNYIDRVSIDGAKVICGSEYTKLKNALREHYSCAGYLWSTEPVDKMNPCKQDKRKKIYQYDLNDNLIKVWDSYRECEKVYSQLRTVLRGVRTSTKGYKFTKEELIKEIV